MHLDQNASDDSSTKTRLLTPTLSSGGWRRGKTVIRPMLSNQVLHKILMNLILPFALVLGLAVSVFADDWPQFRGPNGNAVAAEAILPTKLDAESIAWSANLPGRGLSSP